jgi:D-galactose 1-dehydrogenase
VRNSVSIALVGIGKIARDQHVPALQASDEFTLAATVSRNGTVAGIPAFTDLGDMLEACPAVSAVSICTPPRGRLSLVQEALALGLDVMIEKPPAATSSEAEALVAAARSAKRRLFVTWHSREAAGVEPACAWVRERKVDRVQVLWKENVRVWHPGQEWIWEPGIGVFDPGINALSVLTRLLPDGLLIDNAALSFPINRDAPIAASLRLSDDKAVPVEVEFDFDQRGQQTWEIRVDAGKEALRLIDGGARLSINGVEQVTSGIGEYPRLYKRFAELLETGKSDTDLAPFRLVADAFLLGRRHAVDAFSWED